MSPTRESYLFAGPSLYFSGRPIRVPAGLNVRPPARRGDVAALCREHSPGTFVLADGLFHQCASVGHAEIRDAMRDGWRVWGLCSLGAIRAYEMRALGMRGFGRVFEMFGSADDFQDDEVALLHASEPPYRPLSEPLVHLRAALESFVARNLCSEIDAEAIEKQLKSLWYGERSLTCFQAMLRERLSGLPAPVLRAELNDFDKYRLKSLDMADFLCSGLWQNV